MKFLVEVSLFILGFALDACTYRFSNDSVKVPYGSKKLAIEAVYDTGSEVFPQQILWNELQKSFAARGKMRLTSVRNADLVLRTHVEKSFQAPGNIERDVPNRDQVKGRDIIKKGNPRENLTNLSRAGSWTKQQGISVKIRIEIWNMHTGDRVFSHLYDAGSGHKTMFADNIAGIMGNYLLHEEGQYTAYRNLSRAIAEKVVVDYLL